MGYLIGELLSEGLLHEDVRTVAGGGLSSYTVEPRLDAAGNLTWEQAAKESGDPNVLATVRAPFQPNGGLTVLDGNMGRAVIKVSAVKPDRRVIEAPARIFMSQEALQEAFKAGELTEDFVAVLPFQGPRACGMPELHKLTPALGVLQDRGLRVALVTDGRMSGASGKVPAAIHVTPEAVDGGPISRVRDGDIIRVDADTGRLEVLVDAEVLAARTPLTADLSHHQTGLGRELFAAFRASAGPADEGAHVFGTFG